MNFRLTSLDNRKNVAGNGSNNGGFHLRIAPDAVVRLLALRISSDSCRDGPPLAPPLAPSARLIFDAELVGASKSGIKLNK